MLDAAADAAAASVRRRRPDVVDLGIGTGALSARVIAALPAAQIVGIDADPAILSAAVDRLGALLRPVHGSFERAALPRCDAIVASLALHHLPTRARKLAVYRHSHAALRPGGVLINADCAPASDAGIAEMQQQAWHRHMRAAYSDREVERYFRAWAEEDVYVPLDAELAMMRAAGFEPDVVWRRGPFAVMLARKGRRRRRVQ